MLSKKASVSKSCSFLCPLYTGKGNFKQRQASLLIWTLSKGCSEGAWKSLAKSLSAFLSAEMEPLCAQSPSALAFPCWRRCLSRASLDCDSSGGSLLPLALPVYWPSIMPLTTSIC